MILGIILRSTPASFNGIQFRVKLWQEVTLIVCVVPSIEGVVKLLESIPFALGNPAIFPEYMWNMDMVQIEIELSWH